MSDDSNRFMARLGDALTLTVTRNLLDVLAPTPPTPPRPAANNQEAAGGATAAADDTIFIDDDDEHEGAVDRADQDARRMNEVFIGKFPTRAHRSHLERLLFEHLGLDGSPSDITVMQCNPAYTPGLSYALVTLNNREDVETLLALSPINFLGSDVTVELSNFASQARQRALQNQPRRRGSTPARRQSSTGPSTPARRQSSTELTTPTRRGGRRTITGAAHASLRKQVMDKKDDLKKQFRTKFQSLQEEMNHLEGKQRESEAEKDRLERDLANVKRTLAGLSSQKETLMQRFCQHSEAHDSEMQELEKTLALLHEEDVQEDPGEEEATGGEQTPLRSRMTDALECPCCFNDMRAEIFQCRLGHLICCSCLRRLRDCPVCRTRYPNDPIRALFAEQMAQSLANNPQQQ